MHRRRSPAATFNDTLSGLGGDDDLQGSGGDDTLDGGAGGDTLIGGAGSDAASYDSAGDGVTVNLGAGAAAGGDAAGDTLSGIEDLIGARRPTRSPAKRPTTCSRAATAAMR